MTPEQMADDEVRHLLGALQAKLERDTHYSSNSHSCLRHAAYHAIVALGRPVVPVLIEQCRRYLTTGLHEDGPGWWVFHALSDITGRRIRIGGPEVQREGGFIAGDYRSMLAWWVRQWDEGALA